MKVSKKFTPKKEWYKNKILIGDNLNFDKKKDFVVIPEIWAHFANDLKFSENNNDWHHKILTASQYDLAIKELDATE